MDPKQLVIEFIDAWNAIDLERIISMLDEQVLYHNIPKQPITGKAAVREYLMQIGEFEEVNWTLKNIATDKNTVLTERVDEFVLNGKRIHLPVMGTFEISNDKIKTWRDYFDIEMYRKQLK